MPTRCVYIFNGIAISAYRAGVSSFALITAGGFFCYFAFISVLSGWLYFNLIFLNESLAAVGAG